MNYYSPVDSPNKDHSPVTSPLKKPRGSSAMGSSYQPMNREQIIGKPIEII